MEEYNRDPVGWVARLDQWNKTHIQHTTFVDKIGKPSKIQFMNTLMTSLKEFKHDSSKDKGE